MAKQSGKQSGKGSDEAASFLMLEDAQGGKLKLAFKPSQLEEATRDNVALGTRRNGRIADACVLYATGEATIKGKPARVSMSILMTPEDAKAAGVNLTLKSEDATAPGPVKVRRMTRDEAAAWLTD